MCARRRFSRRGGVLWLQCGATLASSLEEYNRTGRGDVERGDFAGHGNPQQAVAGAADQVVQAGSFASEDDYGVRREVEVGVIAVAALVEAGAPEIALLERFQRADHIDDAGDAEMLGSPSGRFDGDGAEGGRTAFGEQDAVDTGGFRSAEERAEVLGVFDAVESEDEAGLRSLEEIFEA